MGFRLGSTNSPKSKITDDSKKKSIFRHSCFSPTAGKKNSFPLLMSRICLWSSKSWQEQTNGACFCPELQKISEQNIYFLVLSQSSVPKTSGEKLEKQVIMSKYPPPRESTIEHINHRAY